MSVTWFVHGMASDGDKSVDLLAEACQRLDTSRKYVPLGYQYVSMFDAWRGLKTGMRGNSPSDLALDIGKEVYDKTKDGDSLVVHSMGAIAAWSAMWLGRKFDKVVCFAGALDEDRLWPALGMRSMLNVYCPDDRILKMADNVSLSDFGGLGRYGYKGGHDPRITNMVAHPMTDNPDEHLHSFYFKEPDINHWSHVVVGKIDD